MTESAAELIDPRDAGLRTLDLAQPLFDAEALARADAVLEAMSGEMHGWLEADIVRLQRLRVAAEKAGWNAAQLEALLAVAHDIKGAGATYGSPLATRIAASLCRLIETDVGKAAARRDPALAAAHVDALRAAVRDRISLDAHPIGRALLRALEARVEALGVAPV